MKKSRIAAIIIAAGYSSRMNSFKPLLKFENSTVIERLIHTYVNAGIQDIYIVVGYKSQTIIEKLNGFDVNIVFNEAYDEGMFTSVKKGILALDQCVDAFFMQPVDIPLIKTKTLLLLENRYLTSDKAVIYPTFAEKRGHPPLIDCNYNSAILTSNGEGGLKRILETFSDDSLDVPVFDEAILMDMDRKEDYEKLVAYANLNAPNKEECLAILKYYQVPNHIIRHCEVVEGVAHKIYNEISSNGISLDDNALFAAALLHDIARKEKNHSIIGSNIIKEIGYNEVGDIMASHMDIKVRADQPLTEKEILYLADKLVKEDLICKIDERFEQVIKNQGHNLAEIEKIKERWISAKVIIKKIERITLKGFMYG
ncbi:MAG: DVU_1551 family NTP transferase [Velocimicrobium sp.]